MSTLNEDNASCIYLDGICDSCEDGQIVTNDIDNDNVCDANEIIGCQEELADNYNVMATDPAACIYYGCTDSAACNYNDMANTDQETCVYVTNACDVCSGEQDGTGVLVNNDVDSDGVCNEDEIQGCSQVWADNWVANVTDIDDDSCVREGCMVETMFNFDSLATFDTGGCILFVYGCQDPSANNFNSSANAQGMSICLFEGCMDSLYQNYDPIANIQMNCVYVGCTIEGSFNYEEIATDDDGSCFEIVNGCMDSIADNYNELANTSEPCEFFGCMDSIADNYIEYANVEDDCYFYGCMNVNACNYSEIANTQFSNSCEFPEQYYDCDSLCLIDTNDDGVCNQFEIFGCKDSIAVNYNPLATQDDNTCYASLEVDEMIIVDAPCKEGFGQVQLSISGGLKPITIVNYTSYQANEFIETNESVVTIDNLMPNGETGVLTYSLHVYDANGEGLWYPYIISQPEVAFEMSIEYNQEDLEITFESNSDNYNVEWFFDSEPLFDSNLTLEITSNGVYGLLLTDEFGCSIYEEIETLDLSILEQKYASLNVFPNPASDLVTIYSEFLLGSSSITIHDLAGSLIRTIPSQNSQFDFKVVDVSSLSAGTYIVSVSNDSNIVYTRVVIH